MSADPQTWLIPLRMQEMFVGIQDTTFIYHVRKIKDMIRLLEYKGAKFSHFVMLLKVIHLCTVQHLKDG